MALAAGTRLGPYEILEPLGAGGMGEVYRAKDTRLDRTVAVKVLPSDLAADPQMRARFEREARAISALAHPNICTLHDIGEEDGRTFLVMEHLVGQTVAERLKKGSLPLEQALEVATQVADALAAAHKQDIVHRDLKPGNVMLTKTGARLLDFGLARLTAHGEQPAVESLTSAPTEAAPLTGAGTVMGTLPYMAPEQVEGKPADARTDFWALGTILYEMITGGRAFEASTPTSLVGAILEREPARLGASRAALPGQGPRRALGYSPRRGGRAQMDRRGGLRSRDAGQGTANTELDASGAVGRRGRGAAGRGSRRVVVAGVTGQRSQRASRAQRNRPDCRTPLSPDGRWVGFSVGGLGTTRLRKVPVEGGLAVDLAELSQPPIGASWEADGKILLGSPSGGTQWVPAEGGPPRDITTVDPSREGSHRSPWALPGGRALLFTTMPTQFGGKARIEIFRFTSGERKVVVEDGTDARYLPTGHLIFMRRGVLMAAPFDLERLDLTAPAVPVVEGVSQAVLDTEEAGLFAVSDSGLLVYAPGGLHEEPPIRLVLLDETGQAEPLPGFDKPLVSPQVEFSPDGRQLVFLERARSGLLWLFDVERHTYRLLSDGGVAASPRWSPDGSQLVVSWSEAGPFHLWSLSADGGEWERLTEGDRHDRSPSWSPDGQFLAFRRAGPPSHDILIYRFKERQTVPFVATGARETWPEFSPDGRWLAYASDESGRYEVYVTSFPDREQTLTVSRQGGVAPAWSADGSRLFYHSVPSPDGGGSMMAVTVRHGPKLSLGRPTTLFPLPDGFISFSIARTYTMHPDGRRFLVGIWGEQERAEPITRLNLVHNWFTELERLSPTGR